MPRPGRGMRNSVDPRSQAGYVPIAAARRAFWDETMKRARGQVQRVMVATVAVVASAAAVVSWTALPASAGGVASTGASADVVAQSLVSFVDGDYHFRLSTVAISQTPNTIALVEPTFLLAGGSAALLVSTVDGPGWRLSEGEAAYQAGGSSVDIAALETGAASLSTITIEPGSDVSTFVPGSAVRDVDLVRATLATNGSVTIPTKVALFVRVTAGEVAAGETPITAGATATFAGDVTLTNEAAEPATVVVAVIGPTIGAAPTAPAEAQPDPAPTPAPAPPPAPAATTTTTVDPMVADLDADGLTGADEELRGTDPNEDDSDSDGLTDGSRCSTRAPTLSMETATSTVSTTVPSCRMWGRTRATRTQTTMASWTATRSSVTEPTPTTPTRTSRPVPAYRPLHSVTRRPASRSYQEVARAACLARRLAALPMGSMWRWSRSLSSVAPAFAKRTR